MTTSLSPVEAIPDTPDRSTHPKARTASWVIGLVACLAVFVQIVILHAWYIGHIPITSDEAVGGLMAIGIQHGHLPALYWGQNYGGVEPYVTALLFWVLPTNGVTLQLSAVLIDLVALVVIWRLALRVVNDSILALAVAAIAGLFPLASIIDMSQVYGFRSVTFLMTFCVLLIAVRIEQGSGSLVAYGLLGLAGGIGWWSSPEIAYGLIGAVLLCAIPLWRSGGLKERLARLGVAAVAFIVGSLPWWWVSFHDHFATLSTKMGHQTTIVSRLSVFFNDVLPMQFGFIRFDDPVGLFVPRGGIRHDGVMVLLVVLLGASALSAVMAGGARRGIGLTMLVAPLIYAASPASWFWIDGRYAVYLTPLIWLTLAIGLERLVGWWQLALQPQGAAIATRVVTVVVLLGAMSWTTWQFGWWSRVLASSHGPLLSGYSASDGNFKPLADALANAGVRTGWADYWVSYRMDFLSGGVLHLSPTPNDSLRNESYASEARSSNHSIWLVVGNPNAAGTGPLLSDPAPGLQTWGSLRKLFIEHHISWTVKEIQGLWVITPTTAVDPSAISLGSGPNHNGR